MSIDFSKLTGWSTSKGAVTQVADSQGRIIWMLQSGDTVILEVEKKTSDTYAGETTYTEEQFILLDIYPKTNGTVSVTYGGLTKTITDTSGVAEPNAQQVFFGTFNGVSDSVETPASGELTIEGDYVAFACGKYNKAKLAGSAIFDRINAIKSFGIVSYIPDNAFGAPLSVSSSSCYSLEKVHIPNTITKIGSCAFFCCMGLSSVIIPSSVVDMGDNPFSIPVELSSLTSKFSIENVSLSVNNNSYKKNGNCIIEMATGRVVCGTGNIVIPSTAKSIGKLAFYGRTDIPKNIEIPEGITHIEKDSFNNCFLESVIIPSSVTTIGGNSFHWDSNSFVMTVCATTPPTIGSSILYIGESDLPTIIVPKGCGEIYKTADGWSEYADYIVEES